VAGRLLARLTLLAAASLAAGPTYAEDSATVAQTVTIADLFSPAEAKSFAATMRTDRKVTFRVRVPPGAGPHGVLVFVHPANNAQPMAGWPQILDRRDLVYIAADGFGNDKPGKQRALVALLALKHLSRTLPLDTERRYVGGMSGGGKMASQVLARFPSFFDGALCIVGADYVSPAARQPAMAGKRVVFVTGDKDFNHFDVLAVYKRFVADGVALPHLMDIHGFGHEYPDAAQLDAALELLATRAR
jgi:poly(3-hydroxybutyrate) depolymerase